MNTVDEVRHRVIVARLDQLQQDYDAAMKRLLNIKQYVDWLNYEMSDLWIEKAALEREGGYPPSVLFT